jgi:putative membrane protein
MKRNGFVAGLLITLAACGGSDETSQPTDSVPEATAPRRLSEAEVIGTVLSATEGLAWADSAALSTVTQPAVLRYAQVLRADHRAIADEIKAVADSMKVAGAKSDAGDRLRTGAGEIATSIRDSTADAAMAFLNGQIDVQRQLIGAMDSALIPAATTPMLRQVLQDLRPAMVAHLQRAEQLKQTLTAERSAPRTAAASIPASAARRDTTSGDVRSAQPDVTPEPPANPPSNQPVNPPPVPPAVPDTLGTAATGPDTLATGALSPDTIR